MRQSASRSCSIVSSRDGPLRADTLADVAERLSASDMSSLLAERGPIHVHVGATLIMEGEPPSLEELLDHVSSRLALVPRFRQRISEAGDPALEPLLDRRRTLRPA